MSTRSVEVVVVRSLFGTGACVLSVYILHTDTSTYIQPRINEEETLTLASFLLVGFSVCSRQAAKLHETVFLPCEIRTFHINKRSVILSTEIRALS